MRHLSQILGIQRDEINNLIVAILDLLDLQKRGRGGIFFF